MNYESFSLHGLNPKYMALLAQINSILDDVAALSDAKVQTRNDECHDLTMAAMSSKA